MALASIIGIGGAFASTTKEKSVFNTYYYAVSNGVGSFNWTTVQPNPQIWVCQDALNSYCVVIVITGYTPVNGQQIPSADIVTIIQRGRWVRIFK